MDIPDYPRLVRTGMTEEQKRNHVRKLNVLRRHLSKEQRADVMRQMRADGMTLQAIADAVGVNVATAQRATADFANAKSEIENSRGQSRPAHYAPRQPEPCTLYAEPLIARLRPDLGKRVRDPRREPGPMFALCHKPTGIHIRVSLACRAQAPAP